MLHVKIDSRAFKATAKDIAKWSDGKKKRVRDVVNTSALNIQKKAKRAAAVKTGRLRASIVVEPATPDKMEMRVGTYVKYAGAVERGTGIYSTAPDSSRQPIVIKPKNKKALYFKGAPHPLRQVTVKGMKPRPYLIPAYESEIPAFNKAIEEALQ